MRNLSNPSHDHEVGVVDDTQNTTRIDDARIGMVCPLISPTLPLDELSTPADTQTLVEDTRRVISNILHGRDDRLLLIVGPCSIHDHDQALSYAYHLEAAADALEDDLLIMMRIYFKRLCMTVGRKGYINDLCLDSSSRINEGLRAAQQLLLDVNTPGLPAAIESPDLLSPQYIADLIAWGAIGARMTESQGYRQLTSGLSYPIGFKDGTDGGVQVASDTIIAACASHAFMGMTKIGMAAVFETRDNDDVHIIPCGGKGGPNYGSGHTETACATLRTAKLREQVMVDYSRANLSKSHERRVDVTQDLARQLSQGERRIIDVVAESNLEARRQDLKPGIPLRYGVSITDACLSWTQTKPVLGILAKAVRHRRAYSYDG